MERSAVRSGGRWYFLTVCTSLTVHLAFIRQDDLPAATRRIYGQSFLETLLYLWRPDSLSVSARDLLVVVELTGVVLGDLLGELAGQAGDPDGVAAVHVVLGGLRRPGVGVGLHVGVGPGGGAAPAGEGAPERQGVGGSAPLQAGH